MKHSLFSIKGNNLKSLLVVFITTLVIAGCNCPECPPTATNPAVSPDPPPLPVVINELWKLELTKANYDLIRTAAGASGSITFQFAYNQTADPRLTLAAFATRPGRIFQPIVVKYLTKDATAANSFPLPPNFSLGDQYVRFNGPTGLDQLLSGVPAGNTVESITFTPNLLVTNTPPGPPASVTNVNYHICVKYRTGGGQIQEWCGAAPVDSQPSPPAN
jgi:hypothetical protein